MHTFQPYPLDMLEWNPMNKISQEWFLLVTETEGKVNAMTCSWGGVGHIWNKNSATVYVRASRYTHELIEKADSFSCCFLDPNEKGHKQILKYMGAVSGRNEDKIATARLGINYDSGIPYIDESNFAIICKKMAAVPMPAETLSEEINKQFYADSDYHTMYIGEIVNVLAR